MRDKLRNLHPCVLPILVWMVVMVCAAFGDHHHPQHGHGLVDGR